MAAAEPLVKDSSPIALPGLARALVSAGKLPAKTAEDIYQKSLSGRTSFIAELTGSGAVSAADLAHTLSSAFGAPLLDLDAIDSQRLPKDLLDPKLCQAYRVVVLSKRNNRLIVATADPSDQQAAEKIKFASQMGVDWVIAEYDKLSRMIEAAAVSASETIDSIIGAEFEFDEVTADTSSESNDPAVAEVEDAPVVRFLHKMLLDAFSMRASDIHFEPYEHNYRVRFRIDGELREIASPPTVIKDKLASRIKVISRLDISENDQAQGLPQLIEEMTSGGAESKTKGALEGVKEKVLGDDDDDSDDGGDGKQRSRSRSRTASSSSSSRSSRPRSRAGSGNSK